MERLIGLSDHNLVVARVAIAIRARLNGCVGRVSWMAADSWDVGLLLVRPLLEAILQSVLNLLAAPDLRAPGLGYRFVSSLVDTADI